VQGPIDAGGYRWVTDPTTHGTYVVVARPHAGAWTLTPAPDSPPIATSGSAFSAPNPTVHTSVTRTRRGYLLRWKASHIPGQALRFTETGGNTHRTITTTTKTTGKVRFTPTDTGVGGQRRIDIEVSQDGLPRTELHGARFQVPKPKTPAPPLETHLTLHGTHAVLTWSRSPRAASYDITAKLSDGRHLYFERTARRRKIEIPRVYKPGTVAASIRPVAADGVHGAAKTTRAHFETKHRRRHR
jgi:hypothetical protein